MFNPIVTLISGGQVNHPFAGGIKKASYTQKHVPLVWECMLGTVYARNPETKKVEYFDYDYAKAHAFAQVTKCSDLRVCKSKFLHHAHVKKGRPVLWGIPPK